MTARRRRLAAQVLAVAITLLLGAGDVWARGGGGRGGGGGGGGRGGGSMSGMSSHRGSASNRQSVNRGGPASRGMGSAKRAQTQPSTRPGAGQQPMGRPSAGQQPMGRPAAGQQPQARPGGGGATRPGAGGATRPGTSDRPKPGEKPNRGENAGDRQDQRDQNLKDRQEDRQDFGKDMQEDRQDFWDNQIEEVDWNEVDWDEYHVHDEFEWNTGAWMALTAGTIITIGAWNTMTQQAGCNLEQVNVNGQKYMKCGNTWYIEAWSGEQVHYVAVAPPV